MQELGKIANFQSAIIQKAKRFSPHIIESDRLFFRLRRHATPHFNP